MLARARRSLLSTGLPLVVFSFSLVQAALAQEASEPLIPLPPKDTPPAKETPPPAPEPLPRAGGSRRAQVVPQRHGSLTRREGSAEGGAKDRVCIAPGDIEVGEFLRFLGDSEGLPVIAGKASSRDLQSCICIVTPIENATPEIVRVIPAANGWNMEEEKLADGSRYLRVTRGGTRQPPPAPEAVEGPTDAAAPSRPLVFQVDGGALRPVDARESPLGAQGVEGDEVVTVVTELQALSSQQAAGTLSDVLPALSAADSLRMGPVQGTRQLVLTGKAHLIDRALKIIRALDVREHAAPEVKEPDSILEVFKLRYAEPDEVAAILAAALQVDLPPAIRATPGRAGPPVSRPTPVLSRPTATYFGFDTLIVPDSRTRSLIVRTTREKDIQGIRSLLETLDAPEAKPEIKTRILQLQHAKAAEIAPLVEKFVAGKDENRSLEAKIAIDEKANSLVIQAGEEAWDQILRLLLVLDAALSEDAKE